MKNILSPRNRKRTAKEAVKYTLISFIGGALNLAILYSLTEFFGIYYIISAVIGFIAGGTHNFTLNKVWTFKEKLKDKYFKEYFHFFSVSILSYMLSILILYLLTEFAGIFYVFSQAIAMIAGGSLNFVFNKIYTFRARKKKES
jgi:dolichol-phosphate mannosyltransferase